ncbi:MAG: FKBP-type peptidyl-prolyl cis-trans isomerase [Paludibacteraceae bacterium]|jgi:FKBP-type peptidyl-prolyl cis-trans isomerase FklB|nr:FKBP-type peptidyl-prolyl cis-trans isomerase [Paludibacteraceae bacterium]
MDSKTSYALGLNVASNLLQGGITSLDINNFTQAIDDIFNKRKPQLEANEAQRLLNTFFTQLQEQQGSEAKKAGQAFLEANAKKQGVITTASGLQYTVLKTGDGKRPQATDRVRCHYEGTLIDGTVFDSSYKRGEPAVFGVNQVIQGWVEALQLMNEGSKWRLFIPYNLGYGAHGAGNSIPPYATLIFDVELIKVL